MRKKILVLQDWLFSKDHENWEKINLPHTWNALDGQDGGNDYYRGTCTYKKRFEMPVLEDGEELWVEFEGVAMSATVILNDITLGTHDGGFSTFRFNLTDHLKEHNDLTVLVDNGANDRVYPQKADFTFYGGIYRNVHFVTVSKDHFSLGYAGGDGIKVTPEVKGNKACVIVETWTDNTDKVEYRVVDASDDVVGSAVVEVVDNYAKTAITFENPHLWNGLEDPYLYTVKASTDNDEVVKKFGIRMFSVDAQKGFFLNGRSYPLCGAARHQDRQGVGNALTRENHEEDMKIMLEMGCNTIRLAHYQHDQYFYDLCDEYGIIVWAEIPYITQHMPNARENTLTQMKELVIQNYNHPSIVCWGLSNEITASGGVNEDMIENHKLLNDLCHRLDSTRLTTMAHAFMLDKNDPFVTLADIRSYNLYYGWYLGSLEDNDEWFDDFHKEHPNTVMGLAEYGADANPKFQSEHPSQGDWTEGYQALYHEHMLKLWKNRSYIWAMQLWNMFDFGADGRNEGGKPGQNQKGLVTFDRKIRKDAFYIYKAYLSKESFVHVCGSRYIDRAVDETEIRVYSNLTEITLCIDGTEYETKKGDKVFVFHIPISGEHCIKAMNGEFSDEIHIRKVSKINPQYVNGDQESIVNWFDKPEELIREGYYSILDSMADIKKTEEGKNLIARVINKVHESYGEVAKSTTIPESVQKMMDKAPFQQIMKQAGKAITPAMIKEINHELNNIKKID